MENIELTPKQIVEKLDSYIIGQDKAKRAVAVALRNRVRRLKLPEEIKQAKWVKEERQRILLEAQKEADEVVKEAENRIISMIDEHEITRKEYDQKKEIIENANERSREISNGTKAYADSILAGVQVTLEDALKVIENNRKEVK